MPESNPLLPLVRKYLEREGVLPSVKEIKELKEACQEEGEWKKMCEDAKALWGSKAEDAMTVAELIGELWDCNQDMKVLTDNMEPVTEVVEREVVGTDSRVFILAEGR